MVSARTWREGTLCRAAAGMRFTGIFSPPPRINLSGWACVNGQCASPQWGPREGNGAWWDAYAEAPALANCAWMSAAIAASIDAPSYCPPGDNRASASDSQ